MARLRFDDRDKAALHKLDTEVVISDSNEVAVIAGERSKSCALPAMAAISSGCDSSFQVSRRT